MPLFLRMKTTRKAATTGSIQRSCTTSGRHPPDAHGAVDCRTVPRSGCAQTGTQGGSRRRRPSWGAVRDMDVFREKTMAYIAKRQVPLKEFAPLFRVWDVEYIGRRNDMLVHLSSKQYAKFKKAFWDHLRAGHAAAKGLTALRTCYPPS